MNLTTAWIDCTADAALRVSRIANPNRELRSENFVLHDIENKNYLAGTFEHEGAKCFNNLPLNIKKIESKDSFANQSWKFYFDRALAKQLNLT